MKNLFFISIAAIISLNTAAQCSDTITANDYAQAEQFLFYNTDKYVDHARVDPHWISDTRFWYVDSKANGNDHVLVDASTGKKSVVSEETLPKEPNRLSNRNEVVSPRFGGCLHLRPGCG